MAKSISLRIRIYCILIALILITISGGLITVWYSNEMEVILSDIINKQIASFQAAVALETALVNQKGFVTYYFIDGDPDWLRQLGEHRKIFKSSLKKVSSLAEDKEQMDIITHIEMEYGKYISSKDQVIEHYKKREWDIGQKVHKKAREHFFRTLSIVEDYKRLQTEKVERIRQLSHKQAGALRIFAVLAIGTVILLGILLAFILIRHILEPVRKLALIAEPEDQEKSTSGNEVKELSLRVHGLIENIDQTHSELEKSRESLLQAEKMAMVGKLAASMAHSLRNPLTSVKMRLFSLNRNLELLPSQKEDFEVITDEIRRVNNIVQNFLEFSRPPKLKIQKINPSELIDSVLNLLKHRLESYEVNIELEQKGKLPRVNGDSEQLKEVFVNLIMNACEAMDKKGTISISQEVLNSDAGVFLIIKVADNGPGIPESIIDKVFQPFFTTKEEGTGLGLSIVFRIIEEHGGRIELVSHLGSTFIITLPVKE